MAKRPIRKKKDIKRDLGGLIPPNELNEETASITNQPSDKKPVTKPIKTGRPKDPNKSLRRKYTTMLDPALTDRLKIQAIREGMTTADLIEKVVVAYLNKNESKYQ